MKYAVLFPGQGSQSVGMGEDVFAARPDLLGERATSVLGWPLAEVVAEGPEEELTRTDRAQPALYAVAFALWSEFASRVAEPPSAAAGHSLGEYTALAAAGVLSYEAGLELVAARGAAMAAAARKEPSGMVALLGADLDTAEAIAATRRSRGGRLWVANINAPGQVVLAGGEQDVDWLVANARSLGARRAMALNVAGAFHSPFMEPAADELRILLDGMSFSPSRFPVYANVTARPGRDVATDLIEQLTAPVRFAESVSRMANDGVETFVHIGPGDVTAGLARRTASGSTALVVSSLDDIAAVRDGLSVQ